ncbi:MAG: hypothetical protein HY718_15415, partial [Planctomycetes bacterium]|nr:hypothetical protein [Planctomycetota bacterium]
TVTGLAVGSQTVIYKDVDDWTRPDDRPVKVEADQTVSVEDIYKPKRVVPTQFILAVTVEGGPGTVTPVSGKHNQGSVVTLKAQPEQKYQVQSWSGTDDDSLKTLENKVTMSGDKTVTVRFEPTPVEPPAPVVTTLTSSAKDANELTKITVTLAFSQPVKPGPQGLAVEVREPSGEPIDRGQYTTVSPQPDTTPDAQGCANVWKVQLSGLKGDGQRLVGVPKGGWVTSQGLPNDATTTVAQIEVDNTPPAKPSLREQTYVVNAAQATLSATVEGNETDLKVCQTALIVYQKDQPLTTMGWPAGGPAARKQPLTTQPALDDGDYEVRAWLIDPVGNASAESDPKPLRIDKTPPVLTLASATTQPAAEGGKSAGLTLKGSARDALGVAKVECSADAAGSPSDCTLQGEDFTCEVSIPCDEKEHHVTIAALDRAGNAAQPVVSRGHRCAPPVAPDQRETLVRDLERAILGAGSPVAGAVGAGAKQVNDRKWLHDRLDTLAKIKWKDPDATFGDLAERTKTIGDALAKLSRNQVRPNRFIEFFRGEQAVHAVYWYADAEGAVKGAYYAAEPIPTGQSLEAAVGRLLGTIAATPGFFAAVRIPGRFFDCMGIVLAPHDELCRLALPRVRLDPSVQPNPPLAMTNLSVVGASVQVARIERLDDICNARTRLTSPPNAASALWVTPTMARVPQAGGSMRAWQEAFQGPSCPPQQLSPPQILIFCPSKPANEYSVEKLAQRLTLESIRDNGQRDLNYYLWRLRDEEGIMVTDPALLQDR